MARRGNGLRIDIEGLEALGADMGRLAHPGLAQAIRASLRGAGGEALASEMRMRAPSRTGTLISGIGVHGSAMRGDDVEVGYKGALADGGATWNAFEQRGAWVESGTRPHMIEPKVKNGKQSKHAIVVDGHPFANAVHPGQRGQKVAAKSIKSAEWEVMADIVDQIDNILGGAA